MQQIRLSHDNAPSREATLLISPLHHCSDGLIRGGTTKFVRVRACVRACVRKCACLRSCVHPAGILITILPAALCRFCETGHPLFQSLHLPIPYVY